MKKKIFQLLTKEDMTKADDLNKIMFSALRSVYRYKQMLDSPNTPDILKEQEELIMKDRFSKLHPDEIVKMFESWEFFKKEQIIADAELNQQIDKDLEEFNNNLN